MLTSMSLQGCFKTHALPACHPLQFYSEVTLFITKVSVGQEVIFFPFASLENT